jgi:hypothetical protein
VSERPSAAPTKWGILSFFVISAIVLLPGEILMRVVGDRTDMFYNGLAAGSFFGIITLAKVWRGEEIKRNESRLWRFLFPATVVSATLSLWWESADPR